MRSKNAISPEAFNILLNWLDPDRDKAASQYQVIHRGLVKMFVTRGCADSENLADLTIDRVASKVEEISEFYTGDRSHYFHGVGHKIYLEYLRNRREDALDPDPESIVPQAFGAEYECLRECLLKLSEDQRELILEYYLGGIGARIERRKTIAHELGIELNTLRIRAHRIRNFLEECMEKCLKLLRR